MVVWVRRASQGARFFLTRITRQPPGTVKAPSATENEPNPQTQRLRAGVDVRFVAGAVVLLPEGCEGGRLVEPATGFDGCAGARLVAGVGRAPAGGAGPAISRLAESSINLVTSVYFLKFGGG